MWDGELQIDAIETHDLIMSSAMLTSSFKLYLLTMVKLLPTILTIDEGTEFIVTQSNHWRAPHHHGRSAVCPLEDIFSSAETALDLLNQKEVLKWFPQYIYLTNVCPTRDTFSRMHPARSGKMRVVWCRCEEYPPAQVRRRPHPSLH